MGLATLMWVLAVAPPAFVLATYARLPERVVMHWNFRGEPTSFGPKLAFLVLTLIAPATAWLFLDGPAHLLVSRQPNVLYIDALILAIVCITLIVATVLNLIRPSK